MFKLFKKSSEKFANFYLTLSNASKNVAISNCLMYNLAGDGVYLHGGNAATLEKGNNIVKNCVIHDYSKINMTYTPAVLLYGVGNTAYNNEIYNAPSVAISFFGNDHLIDSNKIHDCLKFVGDMGAIYAIGSMAERGTQIKNNRFSNISSQHPGAYGIQAIYLDNRFSGVEISNNTFENISGKGVFINGGRDNSVLDNTFKNISDSAIVLSAFGRAADWNGGVFDAAAYGITGTTYKSEAYKKYPHLSNILEDEPLDTKYNVVKGNMMESVNSPLRFDLYNEFGSTVTDAEMRTDNTIDIQ